MAKGDANLRYAVHGTGIDSIREGFRAVGMPEHRMREAIGIIEDVLVANGVVDFRWYKPPSTGELCCYWDDHNKNVLWVSANEVHVSPDITRPDRPTNWQKEAGKYVGWLLPGASGGTAGGGPQQAEIATVICPESFIRVPVGSFCAHCDAVHDG